MRFLQRKMSGKKKIKNENPHQTQEREEKQGSSLGPLRADKCYVAASDYMMEEWLNREEDHSDNVEPAWPWC